jgi:hypothetical protein
MWPSRFAIFIAVLGLHPERLATIGNETPPSSNRVTALCKK